ncbi:MAG: hypothetical protein ACJ8R9_05425 [Steroidobacteraceae bacterium]
MSGVVNRDEVVEKLLLEAREVEQLSDHTLEKRRELYEHTRRQPAKVIDYFDRAPPPRDSRERLLRTQLLRIAAQAILDDLGRAMR